MNQFNNKTMKQFNNKATVILIVMLSTISVYSQTAGNSGMAFLKYGFGARSIALGDAGNSLSNDLTSLFYNPAKLALTDKSEVLFMHNEWIQDISSEVVGVKTEFWNVPIAFGFNVTSIGEIEYREIPSTDPISKFDYNYFFGSISSGFDITEEIFFGASFKYLYEGVLNDEATGYGLDFGVHYLLPYNGLTASAVIKNIGSMDALRTESTKLPSEFRIGTAYTFSLEESYFDFTAGVELLKYLDTEDNHFNFGGEVVYKKLIAARAGYQTGFEDRGLTTGVGLMWGNLKFDYAFLPFSLGLGSANLFSLQFKF
jgi:hypothetical protein